MNKFKYQYFFFILKIILINNFLFQNSVFCIPKRKTLKQRKQNRKLFRNKVMYYCIICSIEGISIIIPIYCFKFLVQLKEIKSPKKDIIMGRPLKIEKHINKFFNNKNIFELINDENQINFQDLYKNDKSDDKKENLNLMYNDFYKEKTNIVRDLNNNIEKIMGINEFFFNDIYQTMFTQSESILDNDLKYFVKNFMSFFQYLIIDYKQITEEQEKFENQVKTLSETDKQKQQQNNIYIEYLNSLKIKEDAYNNILESYQNDLLEYYGIFEKIIKQMKPIESEGEKMKDIESEGEKMKDFLITKKDFINPIIEKINYNFQQIHNLFFKNLFTLIKFIILNKQSKRSIKDKEQFINIFKNMIMNVENPYKLNESYLLQKKLNHFLNEAINSYNTSTIVTITAKNINDFIEENHLDLNIKYDHLNDIINEDQITYHVFYENQSPINIIKHINTYTEVLIKNFFQKI